MHPKAATLALAGFEPLRHRDLLVGKLGYRVGRARSPGARMLYLLDNGATGVGLAAGTGSYIPVQWDDIPLDLWDGVTDKMIEYLLGEMT